MDTETMKTEGYNRYDHGSVMDGDSYTAVVMDHYGKAARKWQRIYYRTACGWARQVCQDYNESLETIGRLIA